MSRLQQSHDEDEFIPVLPQKFRVKLTHIQLLTYYNTPDYNLVSDVFTQAITSDVLFCIPLYYVYISEAFTYVYITESY